MPCKAGDNSIGVGASPGNPIPGFGLPFAPIQPPLPDWDLPLDLIEDLLDLMRQIGALFPSGLFKTNLDSLMRNVMDFIANILTQLAPFLSFYNFIMALLNIIICIIEVLCAIPNPVALAIKLKKLFAECIPAFLRMFPWFALLAMIIALLLLILALIQYIIETILAIIRDLLANLGLLQDELGLQNAETTLAIAQKIASLLCLIENIMAIFLAIAAILAVIQALMLFAGTTLCDDEDPLGCCGSSICPPFIKNSTDGWSTTDGTLVYYGQIDTDVESALGIPDIAELFNLPSLRQERWQLFDEASAQEHYVVEIVTPVTATDAQGMPIVGQIFYPDAEFDENTPITRAPYTVDIRALIDPATFGHDDTDGERYMRIKDCVVVRKPYVGVIDYKNETQQTNTTGTLNIEGGLVYEDDGDTQYNISGVGHASLNDLIHFDPRLGSLPFVDDGYTLTGVEFTWKPVHPVLVSHDLITIGCMPEVGLEKAVQNAKIIAEGIEPVLDKLSTVPDGDLVESIGVLPNVAGTQECVQSAINTLRKNITFETVAEFQATVETCLGDLQNQTSFAYCGAVIAGVSAFNSTMDLDTDVQFTSRPIMASVVLKDAAGTTISNNMPEPCASNVADLLDGYVTFGEVSDFVYDGYGAFEADITSEILGSGELTVSFNDNILSTITQGTDFNTPSSISENVLPYSFVETVTEPGVRRDEADIAGDGE
jgi:hypothetical protein